VDCPFGWAKPVPSTYNLGNGRWGSWPSRSPAGANVSPLSCRLLHGILVKLGIRNYELMAVIGLTYQTHHLPFQPLPLPPWTEPRASPSMLPGRQAESSER
jgi:hypothetical protein